MLIEMARLSRDQRHRQNVKEKAQRQADFHHRTLLNKDRIAEAVHRAVCEATGSDGSHRCVHYAVAGAVLLRAVTGKNRLPQVGSLYLSYDPAQPEMWVEVRADDGGLQAGEFHAWIVCGESYTQPGRHRLTNDVKVVDFSSRHFKALVEGCQPLLDREWLLGGIGAIFTVADQRYAWMRPDPPKYIWKAFGQLPERVRYRVDEDAMKLAFDHLDEFKDVMHMAGRHYRSMT